MFFGISTWVWTLLTGVVIGHAYGRYVQRLSTRQIAAREQMKELSRRVEVSQLRARRRRLHTHPLPESPRTDSDTDTDLDPLTREIFEAARRAALDPAAELVELGAMQSTDISTHERSPP